MESETAQFITTLALVEGLCHEVSRITIFESVTTLISESDTILTKIPLQSILKAKRHLMLRESRVKCSHHFLRLSMPSTLMVLV